MGQLWRWLVELFESMFRGPGWVDADELSFLALPASWLVLFMTILAALLLLAHRRAVRLRILSELAWAAERNLPFDPLLAALEADAWNGVLGFERLGWRRVVAGIRTGLHGGELLGEACRPWRRIFGAHRLALLVEAERAGRLEAALKSLVEALRAEDRARHEVRETLLYPLYLLVFGIAAAFVLPGILIFILPTFHHVIEDLGNPEASLFWDGLWLIPLSRFITQWWWAITLAAVAAWARSLWRDVKGHSWRGGWMFLIPGLGGLYRLDAARNFCQTLAALAGPGVPLPEALRGTAASVRYTPCRALALRVAEGVEAGKDAAALLAAERLLPAMARETVALGLRAGEPALGCGRAVKALEDRLAVRRQFVRYAGGAAIVLAAGAIVAITAGSVFGLLVIVAQTMMR